MKSRWATDKPLPRTAFAAKFPDNAACAHHLVSLRWPEGFVCPHCPSRKGWELKTKPFTFECAGCRKQTPVTAGTVMHRSKLPLLVWFQAVHILTSHSNGISAEQAMAQLGIGSYKTAWLLLMKLRRAMKNPDRCLLSGIAEVDETEVPLRSVHDPVAGYGIANVGKMLISGAVEISPFATGNAGKRTPQATARRSSGARRRRCQETWRRTPFSAEVYLWPTGFSYRNIRRTWTGTSSAFRTILLHPLDGRIYRNQREEPYPARCLPLSPNLALWINLEKIDIPKIDHNIDLITKSAGRKATTKFVPAMNILVIKSAENFVLSSVNKEYILPCVKKYKEWRV